MLTGTPDKRIRPVTVTIKNGHCHCGCGRRLSSKGLKRGFQFLQGHKFRPSLQERLLEKINKTDSCWLWTGHRNACGYGTIRFNHKMELAHRMMWLLVNGKMPDKCVLHSCDNPSCVNPEHLRLGTHQENITEAFQKGHYKWGSYRKPQSWWKSFRGPEWKP